jgi:hypothetical protein
MGFCSSLTWMMPLNCVLEMLEIHFFLRPNVFSVLIRQGENLQQIELQRRKPERKNRRREAKWQFHPFAAVVRIEMCSNLGSGE